MIVLNLSEFRYYLFVTDFSKTIKFSKMLLMEMKRCLFQVLSTTSITLFRLTESKTG